MTCKNCLAFWARETIYRCLVRELVVANDFEKQTCVDIAKETADEIVAACWGNRREDKTGAVGNLVVERVITWASERLRLASKR